VSNLKLTSPLTLGLVLLGFFIAPVIFPSSVHMASFWSLIPAACAILLAFLSKKLLLSLGSAVVLGAFLLALDSATGVVATLGATVRLTGELFWSAGQDKVNLQILAFVFFILSSVHVMTVTGGLHAVVHHLKRFIKGKRSAEFVTGLLGLFIFIDDYANTMIVGSTMKRVTDRFGISRAKLAFLVDATSAPIAGVALVSTWIGYEVGLFSKVAENFQWEIDGYGIFLEALGFRFYCFFMLIFVFTNIISGVDFGPMARTKAIPSESQDETQKVGPLLCSLLPLGLLLTLVFVLLWFDGGGFSDELHFLSPADWRQVLTTSQNGPFYLMVSSIVAWMTANLTALLLARFSLQKVLETFIASLKMALLPAVILVLAWSLKAVCDDLKSGEFVVSLLGGSISPLWLPLAIFVVAGLTAFSTGTSWGTMAILIPTVSPLAVSIGGGEFSVYTALCLAAILDGAIMGDHCSPVSDTTIMSSISTGCNLVEHVQTQLPYSLIVGSISLIFGYLPQAMGFSLWLSYLLGFGCIVILFVALRTLKNNQVTVPNKGVS